MLSEKALYCDPEFLAAFDDLVLRVLCRICGPARDHFVNARSKMPKIMTATNAPAAEVKAAIRRLVHSGRVEEAERSFGGQRVRGLVCLSRAAWENRGKAATSKLELTEADCSFLEAIGVRVDPEDVLEPVTAG